MDKLENLKKLKQLFDDGVISEKEYSEMKNEILSGNGNNIKPKETLYAQSKLNSQIKKGKFTLSFKGNWSLFDAKTKILINNELRYTEFTKRGFEVSFPIENSQMKLELIVGGVNSTIFDIKKIEVHKNYIMVLNFNKTWGKYNNNFKIIENG
jgi:hypothetical protein